VNRIALASSVAALLSIPAAAWADAALVARGGLSGRYQDLATLTAYPLENGVAGNQLGGLGSGLAHAGGTTFLAIPDRGPNAVSYDDAIDQTTSYITRFHTLELLLAPSEAGSDLPLVLSPYLTSTTLLSSPKALVYGSGAGLGVGSGKPFLNTVNRTHYFTGRSDGYDPATPSTDPSDARLDPESIRVSRDGCSVYVTDEYGPHLYEFDRASGRRVRAFALPVKLAVTLKSPVGSTEISGNTAGRVANKGMEGLAISPRGDLLIGAMQSPLIQDGGTNAAVTRLVAIDLRTGTTKEYAYPLTNIGTAAKPKVTTVSEILAVNDHLLLVDERDGKGLGDGSEAAFKRLYLIDLAGAADVSNVTGEAALVPLAIEKTLFLDLVTALGAHGIAPKDVPAKLEGIAFGQDVEIGGQVKHTLFVSNDDDYIAAVTDAIHPAGLDNPNQWFVFAFDDADLPGYVPQRIGRCEGRR
jgi:hypothetical protein